MRLIRCKDRQQRHTRCPRTDFDRPWQSLSRSRSLFYRHRYSPESLIEPVQYSGTFWQSQTKKWHTVSNLDLVPSRGHLLVVVPQGKLTKARKTRGPHPNLKSFVLLQIWKREIVVISFWVPGPPIWWRHHVIGRVFRRLVKLTIALPCNASVRHVVCLICSIRAIRIAWIQQDGPRKCIVEERVGDKPTWIYYFAGIIVNSKRLAVAWT